MPMRSVVFLSLRYVPQQPSEGVYNSQSDYSVKPFLELIHYFSSMREFGAKGSRFVVLPLLLELPIRFLPFVSNLVRNFRRK
jgi:hypothetical protein